MGTAEERSFLAIAEEQRAEFISYREVIAKLAEFTGDTWRDVAAGLKSHGIHFDRGAYLAGPERAVRSTESTSGLAALLNKTIESGKIAWAHTRDDDSIYPTEWGWYRSGLIYALRSRKLPCPDSLRDADDMPIIDSIPIERSPDEIIDDLMKQLAEKGAELALLRISAAEANDSKLHGGQSELDAAMREIERLKALLPPLDSPRLKVAFAVQREFWVNASNPERRPKAEMIVAWIRKHFPEVATSDNVARSIEQTACPTNRDPSAK